LISGDNWRISDIRSRRLHFHNCFEVGVCHSDSGVLSFDNSEMHFKAGDVTCIPRHISHTTYSDKGKRSLWSYLFVDFEKLLGDTTAARSAFGRGRGPDVSCLFEKAKNPRAHFYATSIIEELQAENPGYKMIVKSLFEGLYYEILRLADEPGERELGGANRTYSLAPALECVYSRYMDRLPIEELAEMCHLSATHFRRVFLSVMGTTPLSFTNEVRIEKACELLDTTTDSILSVSEAVGFSSVSGFSRSFQQIMGVSPRSYRNRENSEDIRPKRRCILPYTGWVKAEEVPEEAVQEEAQE
ncbi:MAG: AraC family transcriptional regulator, partial [Clostridiales bacterium]|nr:AraC family transcriptional regulator [Clostridiales bacterium]